MMLPIIDKIKTNCHCSGCREQHPHAILYNILSQRESGGLTVDNLNNYAMPYNCHCEQRRVVCLKNPEGTSQVASDVLVKTICFMSSLPSFSQLPAEDQLSLLRDCWVPLFVLGLAQERIVFEVTDMPDASKLRQILLNGQGQRGEEEEKNRSLPSLAGVHKLRSCLHKIWALDLSPKEYAYLKGAMLFNPDVQGLCNTLFIESLQQEAQRALQGVIHTLHPGDLGRFSRILLAVSTIQTVSQSFITELFFRPVIAQSDLFDLLSEMLFVRHDYR